MYQDEIDKFATLLDLLQQLTDQNDYNRKMCESLKSLAVQVKTQAAETASVTPLHRFNVDLSKEVFESELERTNAQAVIENHSLLHENRQLSLLLKEYEQTMDTVMAKFRNHALAAAQHEITLAQHYQKLLHARDTSMHVNPFSNSSIAVSIYRLAHLLRALTRSMAGEDPAETPPHLPHPHDRHAFIAPSTYPPNPYGGDFDPPYLNPSPESPGSPADASPRIEDTTAMLDTLLADQDDWAHEREHEISRLGRENEALRRWLGIDAATAEQNGWLEEEARDLLVTRYVPIHPHGGGAGRSSSPGTSGLVGLFGRGMDRPGSPVLGSGMFAGMRPPPPSPFMSVPSNGGPSPNQDNHNPHSPNDPNPNGLSGLPNVLSSQISLHLSQNANSGLGVVTREMQVGMGMGMGMGTGTGTGTRGTQGRRPAMFGRGRGGSGVGVGGVPPLGGAGVGGAGGAGTQLAREVGFGEGAGVGSGGGNGGGTLEKPWQAQVGLDLS